RTNGGTPLGNWREGRTTQQLIRVPGQRGQDPCTGRTSTFIATTTGRSVPIKAYEHSSGHCCASIPAGDTRLSCGQGPSKQGSMSSGGLETEIGTFAGAAKVSLVYSC
ncbi:unnamed protein product, partial [Ectocarpus sp. 4 AP-2014]